MTYRAEYCEDSGELYNLAIDLEFQVEELKLKNDFLFNWLIEVLEFKDNCKGNRTTSQLVQDAIDDFIRIKRELNNTTVEQMLLKELK